ncbi:MAG: ABC transporter substrate-binding protein [Alcaligenaceae bacterium]|nr:ABC transporter substrate-binding protein [Alcaligenaceae bacterium]
MPELSKLAPTVSFTSAPNAFLKSFRETNLALGQAFGKEEQARAALASIDKNLEALHQASQGKKGALLFSIRGNVIPHAPGDRFGYAYELTGLESVLPARDPNTAAAPRPEPGSPEAKALAEQRAQAVSAVAAAEPDWLLVLDRGAINGGERTAADTLAAHPELSQTQAFKEGRVVYVDPNGWYIVGEGLNNMRTISASLLEAMQ